ncbi:DUF2970 domain-containing protein [Photobacterium sp. SDRW27]|uniref:DUF2970 domain-containing protein n=1 Tax=Photobacterium obscurum TaxID=2829490 RepID=UPI0022444BA3|nr:DUF2970 domain-containing protein [Photobacterium obscurum]MCW8329647.1 DUF2970 domain-containing protein [Photobacterium obscurum]
MKSEGNKPATERTAKSNIALSVAAALFGVQSDSNRQADFAQRSPWPFIIGGIVAIVLFVAVLLAITFSVTAAP